MADRFGRGPRAGDLANRLDDEQRRLSDKRIARDQVAREKMGEEPSPPNSRRIGWGLP